MWHLSHLSVTPTPPQIHIHIILSNGALQGSFSLSLVRNILCLGTTLEGNVGVENFGSEVLLSSGRRMVLAPAPIMPQHLLALITPQDATDTQAILG